MKKKFECSNCEGRGYVQIWEMNNKEEEWLEITDCQICEGKGYLNLEVKDLRNKTKKKKLIYNIEY